MRMEQTEPLIAQDETHSKKYTVKLTKQIVPGHWTRIIANVEDSDGYAIRRDPHDRIDLGFLPADADASDKSQLPDNGHLQCIVDTTCSPETPEQHDQNRDGNVDTRDVTRNAQLLNGTNTTQAWVNVSLPARP